VRYVKVIPFRVVGTGCTLQPVLCLICLAASFSTYVIGTNVCRVTWMDHETWTEQSRGCLAALVM
jgi:hypothetical protein